MKIKISPRIRLAAALIVFFVLGLSAAHAQSCTLSSTDPSVTICTPTANATVSSPVNVTAGTTDSHSVKEMQIYVDGAKVYQVAGNTVNTNLTMSAGSHRLTVLAQDSAGATPRQTIFITVSAGNPAPCTLNTTNPSVTICSPANNATVTSPVNVSAGTTDSNSVKDMQIYVDRVKVYQVSANTLNTNLGMTNGQHRLTVLAQDSAGATFSQTINITVGPASGGGLENIRHIIFFVQENRSFDNYFGLMGQYRQQRGYNDSFDGLPLNVSLPDMSGQPVSPYHFRTVCTDNVTPAWNESHVDVDGGKMDKFMKTTGSVPSKIDPEGTRAMGYYDWTDLPYYYELAFQFGTSDRYFSSVLAPTYPNRMYLFAGTSFGHIRPDTAPSGGWPKTTIFDLMREHNVSWRYYYQDNSVYLAQWAGWNQDKANVYNISHFYTDIQNESTLPSVIFIEHAAVSGLDEHAPSNIQKGAADAAKIINALINSPSWSTSAFILTYDEGGGFYDHVPPQPLPEPDNIQPMLRSTDLKAAFNQTGFRVPLVVVSPWSKPHFVSHVVRDHTSILKLIETRFGLPPLTQRDAAADDMEEFFDFSSPHFLTPPPLPAQPTNGTCNLNLEKAPGH